MRGSVLGVLALALAGSASALALEAAPNALQLSPQLLQSKVRSAALLGAIDEIPHSLQVAVGGDLEVQLAANAAAFARVLAAGERNTDSSGGADDAAPPHGDPVL